MASQQLWLENRYVTLRTSSSSTMAVYVIVHFVLPLHILFKTVEGDCRHCDRTEVANAMKLNDNMSRNSRVLAHTVDDACIDDEWPGKALSSGHR